MRYPLEQYIKEVDKLLAHTSDTGAEPETLEQHLDKTIEYLYKIYKEKNLAVVRDKLYKALGISEAYWGFFDEMAINLFYMHDAGKCNVNFQLVKMNNRYFKGNGGSETYHALLSAALYIEYFLGRMKQLGIKGREGKVLRTYMVLNAYVIARHHTKLETLESFEGQLQKLYDEYQYVPNDNRFKLLKGLNGEEKACFTLGSKLCEQLFIGVKAILEGKELGWQATYPYIYTKLMYSLLVACDFYATSDYMEQEEVNDIGNLTDPETWKQAYEKNPTYEAICQYEKQTKQQSVNLNEVTNINVLRSKIFLEAIGNLKQKLEEDILYLEAPTGGGKTNTSIGLTMELLKQPYRNKVFYIFPFNTLVEQTKKALDEAFKENPDCYNQITVVNSITPIVSKQTIDDEAPINYNRMLLDRQFFHYPWVITSHVQFFNLMFGTGREDGVGLYQLIGSVVILDEVQSYRNAIWTEMIHFLKAYAKVLNIKIIIMSATLPQLGQLMLEQEEIPMLITQRERYFNHYLFKDRVQLDFSLLEEEEVYEALMEQVVNYAKAGDKKILVEFIKKKTAMDFYNDLVNRMEEAQVEIMLLTGDDSSWEREKCIQSIKKEEKKGMVLVATQLIEAGVDIDMDYGFKDISLLDAEEQFLGRINRSCKKTNCKAFFFNLDSATVLYKGDCRKNQNVTLMNQEMQRLLRNKDFAGYYGEIFKALKQYNEACTVHNLEDFRKEGLQQLNFEKVKSRMQLIEEDLNPYTVFLGITMEIQENGQNYILDGKCIWEQYKALLHNSKMTYAEKKVRLSQLRKQMSCFMWKVNKVEVGYNEQIGDIFYIEDGEQYMINGKFNRELLCGSSFEMI